ncbi:MAG: hypothetical protein KatS3mg048_1045 [Caldilinea sp.]|jgi:hypothetical protein|nr:MAG: hypothetical protein KatS3mg048_1045 [Caldilinea sp.]
MTNSNWQFTMWLTKNIKNSVLPHLPKKIDAYHCLKGLLDFYLPETKAP